MVGAPLDGVVLALDVDGVLLDPGRGGAGDWGVALEQRFGVSFERLQTEFFARHWADIATGRADLEPTLDAALREMGWPMTARAIMDHWFEADCHLHDPMIHAAAAWAGRGARLVLATTQEHRRAAFLSERLGAILPIERVLYSAALGAQKPHAAFFRAASAIIEAEGMPSRVVFVDDLIENVEGARAHGWTAIHFTHQPAWIEEIERALSAMDA